MTWSLLLPAGAVALSLWALAASFHRLDHELSQLRMSLRRTRAAAVATDDLERTATRVAGRAADIEHQSRTRLHRRRRRRRSPHR